MKFNLIKLSLSILTVSSISLMPFERAVADETVKEQVKEVGSDTKRATKKAVREVKDKTCKMVNGKMECAAKKAKHSIQTGADNVEDAID